MFVLIFFQLKKSFITLELLKEWFCFFEKKGMVLLKHILKET